LHSISWRGNVTPEQMHPGLVAESIAERKRALGKQQKLCKMYWSAIQTTGSGLWRIENLFGDIIQKSRSYCCPQSAKASAWRSVVL